jgi:hypothetical protein
VSIEFLVGRRFIGVLPLSLPSPRAPFPHAQITAFLAVCISHGTTSCITRHCMETSHEPTPRHEHSTPRHNTFHRSPFICTNYAIHLYQLLHTARSLPILRLTTSIDAALAPSLHSCVPTSSHHMNLQHVHLECPHHSQTMCTPFAARNMLLRNMLFLQPLHHFVILCPFCLWSPIPPRG